MSEKTKTQPPSSDREMLHMAFGALKAITPGHPTTVRVEGYLFGNVLGEGYDSAEVPETEEVES